MYPGDTLKSEKSKSRYWKMEARTVLFPPGEQPGWKEKALPKPKKNICSQHINKHKKIHYVTWRKYSQTFINEREKNSIAGTK